MLTAFGKLFDCHLADPQSRTAAMAQLRGNTGYGIGQPNPFAAGGASSEPGDNNTLDAIREQTSKIEDLLNTYSEPIKP